MGTTRPDVLCYFFSIKQKESAYLFERLDITEDAQVMKLRNQHSVIFLTLKGMKNSTFEKQLTMFSYLMRRIIRNNHESLASERINEFDEGRMEDLYRGAWNEVELQNALRFISGCLEQHYREQVIILIDEQMPPAHGMMSLYRVPT